MNLTSSASLRADARAIFEAGLSAADPKTAIHRGLSVARSGFSFRGHPALDFPESGGRLLVVGAGKAAAHLALALEAALTDFDWSGRIIVKHGHQLELRRILVEQAGHPVPDEASLDATRRLIGEIAHTSAADRVFFLLTGGASALLVSPAEGISFQDQIETTRLILSSGANIHEFNAVRKHLSAVKGGQLMRSIAPAQVLTLIVSDVVGDDLTSIGSGPTVADPTTFQDCWEILERYALVDRVPDPVRERIEAGMRGEVEETPKPGASIFDRVRHVILASNRHSLDEAQKEAARLGYRVEIFAENMTGDVHARALAFARKLKGYAPEKVALLAGGELTLQVTGNGKGGRSQEFALVASREMAGCEKPVLLAAGTDGTDGPTDAAGAFADGQTWSRALDEALSPDDMLADNDSYHLFDALGDLLRTGPTGTNVMDLVIGLSG